MTQQQILRGLGRRIGVLALVFVSALMPVSEPMAGETVMLKVGTTYEYALEGTPGTGAAWSLSEDDSEGADIVEVEDLGYGEPSGAMIGGPASYRFRLKALEPGSVRLFFVYKRSWETEVWNTQVLRLTIRSE